MSTRSKDAERLIKMNKAVKLLNGYNWQSEGYADKFAWLRDMYGSQPEALLIQRFVKQMDGAGFL